METESYESKSRVRQQHCLASYLPHHYFITAQSSLFPLIAYNLYEGRGQ